MKSPVLRSKYSFLKTAAVVVLIIHYVSSYDCSPSIGRIECECTDTMAECFGIQTNVSEIQDILAIFSFASNIILKINDLQFDPDFVFGNNTINNLTLGYSLQILPSNIFSGLSSSLVRLNLQNNSIEEIGDLFSSLHILEELFLDMNEIHKLKASTFINLSNLKHLSISRNDIHEIEQEVFQNLFSLEKLVLSYNNISLLENINVKSTSLKVLITDNCLIEGSLLKESFSNLPNLEQLDLSYNNLSQITPYSLSRLNNLKSLNVSYNSINRLDENAFSEITNLTLLDLRGNQIQIFSLTSFAELQNLKFLDLSGNKLNAVLCEYTTDFASLEEIYLQSNEIKSFSSGAFFYSPNLKVLDISGNKLECSCFLTDTANYLIENSTMERKDLESIFCIIPTTLSSERIIDYKSSTCTAPEPCKKIDKLSIEDDDEYEDDYVDEENLSSSTTVLITSTPSITHKSLSENFTVTSIPSDTENPLSTVSNATEIENTTVQQTTLLEKNDTRTPINTDDAISATDFSNLTILIAETTEVINNSGELLTETSAPGGNTTITSTSKTQSSSERTTATADKKTTNSTLLPKCFSLGLTVSNISSGSELTIFKNFSYDGDTFCLKWTLGSILGVKSCTIKYTYIGGTKIKNLKCPKFENEVAEFSITEYIYDFCIIIYTNTKVSSCAKVSTKIESVSFASFTTFSEKSSETAYFTGSTIHSDTASSETTVDLSTSPKSFVTTVNLSTTTESLITSTTNNALTSPVSSFTLTDAISTTNNTPTSSSSAFTLTDANSTTTEANVKEPVESIDVTKIIIPSDISTTEKSVTKNLDFFITALNMHLNNSQLVFISWSVNKEEPFHACNLTLTATTQYFDYNEGIFPCKNNTHRLRNVNENDMFKICISSHHEVSGRNTICTHSPSIAKESKSKEDSLNRSLIPLICLLVLFGILAMFVVLKNICKKKQESYKYDVHAEEEKYQQRVKIRPSSSHDQNVRFSYIAKENNEVI